MATVVPRRPTAPNLERLGTPDGCCLKLFGSSFALLVFPAQLEGFRQTEPLDSVGVRWRTLQGSSRSEGKH